VYSLVRRVPDPLPATRKVVAAFDVDGTLTTGDCVVPFLRRAAGARLPLALVGHPVALVRALVRRDRDQLKELACASLRGRDATEVNELGAEFARTFVARRLREDTTARLRRHRELGHTVVLASASLEPYLVPLGDALEVDAVISTRLEQDADGRLTGRLEGANCRGPEKARRVREWLSSARLDGAELWAYGDSPGDAELLATADHAVRVDGVWVAAEPG
jgi:phosphatidylglycerophosphatase C